MTRPSLAMLSRIQDAKRASRKLDASSTDLVVKNLVFVHDAVVATEQLLAEASDVAAALGGSAFDDRLADYFLRHLEEERDHVAWLRRDLESFGVRLGLPDRIAMAMVGTQYYLIKHVHPASLLGYMMVVEGDPTPLAAVDLLEKLHGRNLLRFLRVHATNDLDHRRELFELVDSAPAAVLGHVDFSMRNALACVLEAGERWLDIESDPEDALGLSLL